MSDSSIDLQADEVTSCFPSLTSLRLAHSNLLKRHRKNGSTSELVKEVEEFICRGRETGTLLDTDEDRWASQSLLDYWTAILYRAGREPPDATLVEFDTALAPKLDDMALSADEFYEQLIPEEQVTVKRIFLRMVRPTEGLEVTSNRIQRQILYQLDEASDLVDQVLNKLSQARLLRLTERDSSEDAQVEVAHEALIHNWSRLVDWVEEERKNMRQRLHLSIAAQEWEVRGRDPGLLLQGILLKEALSYQNLNSQEAEFVQSSLTKNREDFLQIAIQNKVVAEQNRKLELNKQLEETLKILLVDDNEVDRMAVRRALTQAGVQMELSEVGYGNDAFSALTTTAYDCVFLDYRLPDQDGLTLIQQLRSSEIKVPLVVLTGQGDEKIAVQSMKAGATDYLSKSRISPETLAQVLQNAILVHRAEMQADLASQQLRVSHEQLFRKNQELERQQQQIQMQNFKLSEEASLLKSHFGAVMSHELRTPINAMIGFSQILLRPKFGQLTHQQTDMVERILNNGKHLLMLVNEVLDFLKLEAGRLDLKAEIFDVSKVINLAVSEMRSLADTKNLSLLVQSDLQNPLVFNDPVRIKQILINLLSNAIKFTESGEIWVEVKELPANQVAITVRDTGIGIAPKDFKRIFESFRQLDETIVRKYPGTGLGLAIIDLLVRMMSGKIFIESQLGVGSMFRIELPRQIGERKISDELRDNSIEILPTQIVIDHGAIVNYSSLRSKKPQK